MIPLFLIGAIASVLPSLDVSAGCKPQSQEMDQIIDYKECMHDEKQAKERLAREWASYPASARNECLDDRAGLLNSYVELLTCIEMQNWKSDLGKLTADGASSSVTGESGGGSPPTLGQIGESNITHPLGGAPNSQIR
jgi:hypothetical protein